MDGFYDYPYPDSPDSFLRREDLSRISDLDINPAQLVVHNCHDNSPNQIQIILVGPVYIWEEAFPLEI